MSNPIDSFDPTFDPLDPNALDMTPVDPQLFDAEFNEAWHGLDNDHLMGESELLEAGTEMQDTGFDPYHEGDVQEQSVSNKYAPSARDPFDLTGIAEQHPISSAPDAVSQSTEAAQRRLDDSYPDPAVAVAVPAAYTTVQPTAPMLYNSAPQALPQPASQGYSYQVPGPAYVRGEDGKMYYAQLAPSPIQRQYAIVPAAPMAMMQPAGYYQPGSHALPAAVHSKKRRAPEPDNDDEDEEEVPSTKRTRNSSIDDSDPVRKLGYTRPKPRIPSWGSKGQFKYTEDGMLRALNDHTTKMSLSDMDEFFFGNPAHRNGKPLTLWIGRQPMGCKERHHPINVYRSCRYKDCPDAKGTIEKGTYSVVCDEFQGTDHKIDPFKLPRFHLWCIERYMDFPRMCRELDVQMDDRRIFAKGAKPDTGATKMSLKGNGGSSGNGAGPEQFEIGVDFINYIKKHGVPGPVPQHLADIWDHTEMVADLKQYFGDYPVHTMRGQAAHADLMAHWGEDFEGPYTGTLGYRMAQIKRQNDTALKRHEEQRERASQAGSRFVDHAYDLAKAVVGRKATRRTSQQTSHKEGRRRRRSSVLQYGPAPVTVSPVTAAPAPKKGKRSSARLAQTKQPVEVEPEEDVDEWMRQLMAAPTGYSNF